MVRASLITPAGTLFTRGLVLASGFEIPDDAPGLTDVFPDTIAGLTEHPEFVADRKWARSPRFYTWLRHALHNLDTVLWKRLELLEHVDELAMAAIAMTSKVPKSEELTGYFQMRLKDADLAEMKPAMLSGFAYALARLELPDTDPVWDKVATRATECHAEMEASQRRKTASALAWAQRTDVASTISEARA
jgi:hypothetical protein